VVGRGGFGVVYRAVAPDFETEIALKVIDLQFNNDPELLLAEKRGAAIQQQISRVVSEIARVYEFYETDQHFCVVMEYVRGEDLSKLLDQGHLAERHAVSIGIRLCRILEEGNGGWRRTDVYWSVSDGRGVPALWPRRLRHP